MTITREQILVICSDPLLGPPAMDRLSDPEVSRRPSASLTDLERKELTNMWMAGVQRCQTAANLSGLKETFSTRRFMNFA